MQHTSGYLAKRWLKKGEEVIELTPRFGKWPHVMVAAKVDTGADRTSIHEDMCIALGWEITGTTVIRNSNGRSVRNKYLASFIVDDIEFVTEVTGTDRSKLSHPMLLGRDILREALETLEEE